jgi:hypothetical protein
MMIVSRLPRFLTPQEAAILLLRLIELRGDGAPTTRVRISELTLRRLWGRSRLSEDFIKEVQEWVTRGGWTLFQSRSTYAAIKTSSVMNWPRVSSSRLAKDLNVESLSNVHNGAFDFGQHARLISDDASVADDEG